VFQVQPPVCLSLTLGKRMIERLTPMTGMRICTGGEGGTGVGVGVGDWIGVGVGDAVGTGVEVGVADGVKVIAGMDIGAMAFATRNRSCLMSQLFSALYAA
jgi:hypothetical protein